MDGRDFYDRINADPRFEWLGSLDAEPGREEPARALVRNIDRDVIWWIAIDSILESLWDDFVDMMTTKRNPDLMIGMSRIVGYYAQTKNWNRSKLRELKDRQAGQYAPPEVKAS